MIIEISSSCEVAPEGSGAGNGLMMEQAVVPQRPIPVSDDVRTQDSAGFREGEHPEGGLEEVPESQRFGHAAFVPLVRAAIEECN